MPIYNQDVVIDQLNRYLKFNQRQLKLKYGYCHGFTLLWLHCMSQGREEWFYNTIQNLIACKTKRDFAAMNADIEQFISHLEWLQNSDHYINEIHQLDVDKVLDYHRDISLSFLFSHKQLNEVLEKVILDKKIITVSGPNHTIGVFHKEGKYYVFDPNYDEGRPRVLDDVKRLKSEIINCHFRGKKLPGRKLPIEINVAHDPMDMEETYPDKMEIYNELIAETSQLDQEGIGNTTNLYLACESGDAQEVEALLRKEVDVNKKCGNDFTPLQMAATRGYTKICGLLLAHGAEAELADSKGVTPLFLAARNGHLSTARVLLEHRALPIPEKRNEFSPLHIALSLAHWDVALLLLAHIKNTHEISSNDLKLLRAHHQDLMFHFTSNLENFTNPERLNLNHALNRVFITSHPDGFFSRETSPNKTAKRSADDSPSRRLLTLR